MDEQLVDDSEFKKKRLALARNQSFMVGSSLVLFCFCWGYRQLRKLLAA
jgi:hypothetical protein